MPVQKYKIGDDVYGKWPGSSLYYKGNVTEYDPIDNVYKLKFEEDSSATDTEVNAKDVKALNYFEKTKTRRRSRSSSPSRRRRSKSPARKTSPSRRASPARKPSPARKSSPSPKARLPRSPARQVTQKLLQSSRSATVSVKKVSSEKSVNIKFISDSFVDGKVEDVRHRPVLHQPSDVFTSPVRTETSSVVKTRRMTRSVTRATQQSAEMDEKEVEVNDTDTDNGVLSKLACLIQFSLSCKYHLLLMLLPLMLVYGLFLTCKTEKKCTIMKLPLIPKLEKFFKWKSLSYVFGWFTFQAVISMLPFGKIVAGPTHPNGSRLQYRLNGLASFFISFAVFITAQYFKKYPAMFVTTNLVSFVTASCLFTLFLTCVVFIHSRCGCATAEPSGGVFADFVCGRVTNARFFNGTLDIKKFALMSSLILWGILSVYFLMKAVNASSFKDVLKTNPSLVMLVAFQLWFILDGIFFEETFLHSGYMSQKIGYTYLFTMFGLIPFFNSVQARYLVLFPVSLPWYCYVIPVLLYVIGYYIYRVSTLQKFNFRKDPHQAKLSGVDYIVTANQKNILIGGWWGRVRHPNYLGDLMMRVAWSSLCGFQHGLPWISPLIFLGIIIMAAFQDDAKCKQKYSSSWEEYQEEVKYKIIPYVF